jgi:hypothetical protein
MLENEDDMKPELIGVQRLGYPLSDLLKETHVEGM